MVMVMVVVVAHLAAAASSILRWIDGCPEASSIPRWIDGWPLRVVVVSPLRSEAFIYDGRRSFVVVARPAAAASSILHWIHGTALEDDVGASSLWKQGALLLAVFPTFRTLQRFDVT